MQILSSKAKKKQFKSISIIKTKLAIGELVNKRSKLVIEESEEILFCINRTPFEQIEVTYLINLSRFLYHI